MQFSAKTNEYGALQLKSYEFKTLGANPKALLFFFPEVGDQVRFYGHFFKKISDLGIAVYGFDERGTGLSMGTRSLITPESYLDAWSFID